MRRIARSAAAILFVAVACQSSTVAPTPTPASPTPTATLPTEPQRREHLEKVWSTLKENYYRADLGGVDWDRVRTEFEPRVVGAATEVEYRAALSEMVGRLGDGHSRYVSPSKARDERLERAGGLRYGGIGFNGRWWDGLYVQTVFADEPAARAGLRRRDRILSIDGKAPPNADAGLQAIRGPEGTSVRLTVQSPGQAPRDVTLTRAQVKGRARPEARRLESDPRIGYLFVPTFGIVDMGRLAHAELEKIIAPDLAGLVIDLRGNDGGDSVSVLEFLGAFVKGEVLSLAGANYRERLLVSERPLYAALASVPLTVLVDRNTESFSESVAAVLQSLRKAQVVGETTAGNTETIQAFDFLDGSLLWVAVAINRLPNGSVVERVVPDIRVDGGWIDHIEREDPYVLRALALLKSATR